MSRLKITPLRTDSPTIHVGMHKTATTSIQSFIDSCNLPGFITFLNGRFPQQQDIIDRIAFDPFLTVTDLAQFRSVFSGVNLISTESLSGVREDLYRGAQIDRIALNVSKLFGENSTILVTTRDPLRIIASMYVDVVLYGAELSFEQWLKLIQKRNWFAFCNKDLVISSYKRYFENVISVDVDMLLDMRLQDSLSYLNISLDGSGHVRDTLRHLIPQKNVSPSLVSTIFQRLIINRFFKTKNSVWWHTGLLPSAPIYKMYRYNVAPAIDVLFKRKATLFYYNMLIEMDFRLPF